MTIKDCIDCEKAKSQPFYGIYNFNCPSCRTRFIQSEPCKYYRKVLVEKFTPRYGVFDAWQEGVACQCTKVCKRKAAVQQKQTEPDYEQPTKRGRTKASSRR